MAELGSSRCTAGSRHDAAAKLLYLAVRSAGLRWRSAIEWTAAMGQFSTESGPRFRTGGEVLRQSGDDRSTSKWEMNQVDLAVSASRRLKALDRRNRKRLSEVVTPLKNRTCSWLP